MSARTGAGTGRRALWVPWQLVALVVVTLANYLWQVPYFVHFYGSSGTGPGGLSVLLVLTLVWFLAATALLVARRRGGVALMASFLAVEALFYLVHDLSGAAGKDLPGDDPVLLTASLLGYANTLAALVFLPWLLLARRRARTAAGIGSGGV